MSPALSVSALAMDRFVASSPGLQQPRIAEKIPGLPTLPDLKLLAHERRAAGLPVIDQSAGDIDEVGQPLSEEFVAWIPEARDRLVAAGCTGVRRTTGDAYGFPSIYRQQFPEVPAALARSWGIERTPIRTLQTLSGRTILDFTFRGLLRRAGDRLSGRQPALILDPLAWSGYRPLAADLGLKLVHLPARPGRGLAASAEGLAVAIAFARERGLEPIAALSVLPSNPSGVGLPGDELVRYVETAAAADLPVLLDAFYSPLAPEGHAEAVPLGMLERTLAPEALALVGTVVGETKVTSSQNKTGSVLWFAPEGRREVADVVVDGAAARMRTTNCYPRPQEVLVAYALHTFAGGVHAAMGPRYTALHAARVAMREAADALGLPLSIGGSFYGTAGLVDPDGVGLVRDADGRPLTDGKAISETLISRFGLVGAPGPMFSSAPEASSLIRLTAAVTLEDVAGLRSIMETMLDEARRSA
jgi:aspartate/methionine/tyrosine aminotransferase